MRSNHQQKRQRRDLFLADLRRLLGEDQVPGNPRHSVYVSKEHEDILRGDHTAVQSRRGVLHVHSNKDPPGKA